MAPRINIPPLTRGLIAALAAFSVLNAAARYRSWVPDRSASFSSRRYYAPYLTLVPGVSIMYPWVFVTATFAEQNVFGLLITGAALFYGGRYLERAWSSREYAKFICIIAVVPNVLTFLSYVLLFAVTRNEQLATTAISGGLAIQAAFLVSFKQLVPEHTVTIFKGILRIRVKHFPAVFLLANTISGVAFGTETAMLLSWLGFLTAWTYLRFYRASPSLVSTSTSTSSSGGAAGGGDTIRGDASDTFAFACFFPDAIQPPVAAVADGVYNALVALRLCTPFSAEDVDGANEAAFARRGEGGLPSLLNGSGGGGGGGGGNKMGRALGGSGGGRREEAERRRALALRALDQRLHAATTTRPAPGQTSPLAAEMQYEPELPTGGAPAATAAAGAAAAAAQQSLPVADASADKAVEEQPAQQGASES